VRPAHLALLLLTGCALGDGRPEPFPVDRALSGTIAEDIYTAQDGSFSVTVPHPHDSYEFACMQVKEMSEGGGLYVSFGPAAFDLTIWRLEVAPVAGSELMPSRFASAFEAEISMYREQIEKAGQARLEFESERVDPVGGFPARQRTYVQELPPGVYVSGAPTTLTHEVVAVNLKRAMVFVWVQRPDEVPPRRGLSARAFAESVRLN
jgi:hypothetical protein